MPAGRSSAAGRLTKRPQFLAAASGRRFHTERVTLQGRRRGEGEAGEGLRIGFTITKRVGHATERNRIRRRLRRAAQAVAAPFGDQPVDVVVVGRRPALAAAFDDIMGDLTRGLAAVTKRKAAHRAAPRAAGPQPDSHAG